MLQILQRLAFGKAFRGGGSRGWLVAAMAVWLLRSANRVRKPEAETIYRAKLEPGRQIVIDHSPLDQTGRHSTRKGRRMARKDAKAARREAKAARKAKRKRI